MAYHGRLGVFLVVEAEKLFIRSSGSLRSVVATVEREREAVSLTHILVEWELEELDGNASRKSRANRLRVSTGRLPSPEMVKSLVSEAYERFKSNAEGCSSDLYEALARVPRNLFGVCMVGTSGNVYAVGDTDHPFSIMSVSKPFVFALVCQSIGGEQAREKLGANSTGLPFSSL